MEEHYTAYKDYQYLYWRLNSTCNVSPTSMQADLLRSQSLFIIDEASIIPTPTHALHAIDRCLQDVTGVAVPFGGKVFLLGGDFGQVLPVIPRVSQAVIIDTCLKISPLWSLFQHHRLVLLEICARTQVNTNSRLGFCSWNGTLTADIEPPLPDVVEMQPACNVSKQIVDEIYAGASSDSMHSRVILSPKNDDCLHVNEEVLAMLPGDLVTYFSADSIRCDSEED